MNQLRSFRDGVIYLSETGTLRYVDRKRVWKILPGGIRSTSGALRRNTASSAPEAFEEETTPTEAE